MIILTSVAFIVLIAQSLHAAKLAFKADLVVDIPFMPLIPITQSLGMGIGLFITHGLINARPYLLSITLYGFVSIVINPFLLRMINRAAEAEAAEMYALSLEKQIPVQRAHLAAAHAATKHVDQMHMAIATAYDDAIMRLEQNASKLCNVDVPCEAVKPLAPSPTPVVCNHPALDALMSVKYSQLSKSGIKFKLTCNLPSALDIPATTLCAIVGNLIDNAAHAVEKLPNAERRVETKIEIQRGHLIIQVKNPVEDGTKLPARQRRHFDNNLSEHGWGTLIVEELARRHNGIFTLNCAVDTVIAVVAFPLDKN